MSVERRGLSRLGCLALLALVAAAAYFAFNIGHVYYRYFRYQDAMRQEARFAAGRSDQVIRDRLRAKADSLGLPESAAAVQIRRAGNRIEIWSEYYEQVELPLFVRDFHFNPTAQRTF